MWMPAAGREELMPAAGIRVPEAISEEPQSSSAASSLALGKALVRLLRPRQWIKNGFVLAPLIFSGSFVRRAAVMEAVVATLLFCVGASVIYIFNDLHDLEADRLHPTKRHSRPLAAGAVSVGQARVIMVSLSLVLLGGLALDRATTGVILLYVLINLAYTVRLKEVPVVDLFAIAAGFVLRVEAGAVAIAVVLSPWMLITTLCLALYLASVKRRDELTNSGHATRTVLKLYTPSLLDRFAERAAVGAIVFYGLFVITVRPALAVTIPLVLFGMFRYSFVVDRNGGGESPTDALWRDWPLVLTVLAWGMLCAFTLWRS
jgi:decaprenyl-phosphate phosphoribosyltransferase